MCKLRFNGAAFVTCLAMGLAGFALAGETAVTQTSDGHLKYTADGFGNVVPDFSMAGQNAGAAIDAVTTPVQRQGTVWEELHRRFGSER